MSSEVDLFSAAKLFVKLDQSQRAVLLGILETCDPALTVSSLARKVAGESGLEVKEVSDILSGFATVSIVPADDSGFADHFSKFLAAHLDTSNEFLSVEFSRLLRATSLSLTAKAQSTLWGQGRLFVEAKTITQVRPLFLPIGEDSSGYSVVVHELFVTTKRDNEPPATTGMLLDMEHLQLLKKIIDRAINKERVLRSDTSFKLLPGDTKQ